MTIDLDTRRNYAPQTVLPPSVALDPAAFERFKDQFNFLVSPGERRDLGDIEVLREYFGRGPNGEMIHAILKSIFDPRNLNERDFLFLYLLENELDVDFKDHSERMDFYDSLVDFLSDNYPAEYVKALIRVWDHFTQGSIRLTSFYERFRKNPKEASQRSLSPELQAELSDRLLGSGICHGLSMSATSNQPPDALYRKGRFYQAAASSQFRATYRRFDFKLPQRMLDQIGIHATMNPVISRRDLIPELMQAGTAFSKEDRFILCLMNDPGESNHDISVSFKDFSFTDQNSIDATTFMPIVHRFTSKKDLLTGLMFHIAARYSGYRNFRIDKYVLKPEKQKFEELIATFSPLPKTSTNLALFTQQLKTIDPKIVQANQESLVRFIKSFSPEVIVLRFDSLDIPDQASRIELAKHCAKLNCWLVALHYKKFRIADPVASLEIAKICLEQNLPRVMAFFLNFGLSDYDHPVVEFISWAHKNKLYDMFRAMDPEFSAWAAKDLWENFRNKSLRDQFDALPPLEVEAGNPWGKCLRLQFAKLKAVGMHPTPLQERIALADRKDYSKSKLISLEIAKLTKQIKQPDIQILNGPDDREAGQAAIQKINERSGISRASTREILAAFAEHPERFQFASSPIGIVGYKIQEGRTVTGIYVDPLFKGKEIDTKLALAGMEKARAEGEEEFSFGYLNRSAEIDKFYQRIQKRSGSPYFISHLFEKAAAIYRL